MSALVQNLIENYLHEADINNDPNSNIGNFNAGPVAYMQGAAMPRRQPKMNNYMIALRQWNRKNQRYTVPKKGSQGYNEVMDLKRALDRKSMAGGAKKCVPPKKAKKKTKSPGVILPDFFSRQEYAELYKGATDQPPADLGVYMKSAQPSPAVPEDLIEPEKPEVSFKEPKASQIPKVPKTMLEKVTQKTKQKEKAEQLAQKIADAMAAQTAAAPAPKAPAPKAPAPKTTAQPKPAPKTTAQPKPAPKTTAQPKPAPKTTAQPKSAPQPKAQPQPKTTTAPQPKATIAPQPSTGTVLPTNPFPQPDTDQKVEWTPQETQALRDWLRFENDNVVPSTSPSEQDDWQNVLLELYEDYAPLFIEKYSQTGIEEMIRAFPRFKGKKWQTINKKLTTEFKEDRDWLDYLGRNMGGLKQASYEQKKPSENAELKRTKQDSTFKKNRRFAGQNLGLSGNGLYESSDSDAEYEGEGIGDVFKKVKDVAVGLVKGRREFTPSSRAVLERYGNDPYSRVMVCRKALDDNLLKFIKMTKQGVPYDKLYHLSIRFQMPGGKWLRLDKREDLQASIETSIPPETTCIPVRVGSSAPRTVNEILAKTLKAVGEERFYKYRSTSYNCQRFIADIIQSNDMSTDMSFIMQDVKGLVPSWVDSLANVATDAKARLNLIMQGRGYDCEDCEGGYHCETEVSYTDTNPSNQSRYFAAAVNQQNNAYTQEPSRAAFNANMRHEQRRADTGLTAGGAFPQYPYNATQGFIKGFGQSEPLFAQIPHRTKTDQDYYKLDDVNGVYMKSLNTFD
jgi:hypothetical protein